MQGFGDVIPEVEAIAAPQPVTMDAVPMLALHVSPIRVCSHTPQSVPMLNPRTSGLVHMIDDSMRLVRLTQVRQETRSPSPPHMWPAQADNRPASSALKVVVSQDEPVTVSTSSDESEVSLAPNVPIASQNGSRMACARRRWRHRAAR